MNLCLQPTVEWTRVGAKEFEDYSPWILRSVIEATNKFHMSFCIGTSRTETDINANRSWLYRQSEAICEVEAGGLTVTHVQVDR